MSFDPLILQFLKLLEEDQARELEALSQTNFDNLYVVGQHQGRIQGIKIARKALEVAMGELEE